MQIVKTTGVRNTRVVVEIGVNDTSDRELNYPLYLLKYNGRPVGTHCQCLLHPAVSFINQGPVQGLAQEARHKNPNLKSSRRLGLGRGNLRSHHRSDNRSLSIPNACGGLCEENLGSIDEVWLSHNHFSGSHEDNQKKVNDKLLKKPIRRSITLQF